MTIESDVMEATAIIEELKTQIAELTARMLKLEAAAAPPPPQVIATPAPTIAAPAPQAAIPPVIEEEIPEAILLVIAAAVAAYLGERAHVRQIRLIRTGAWAQEGRVSIQASHRLH